MYCLSQLQTKKILCSETARVLEYHPSWNPTIPLNFVCLICSPVMSLFTGTGIHTMLWKSHISHTKLQNLKHSRSQ